jgi:ABC-type Fe3+-hydroxamate transport system substrate-binding protein
MVSRKIVTFLAGMVCLLVSGTLALAAETRQKWEIVVPAGIIEQASIDPAPRIATLEGKTVALRWNGKHNGDIVLDHLAELLAKQVPSLKIVKIYRDDPSTVSITGNAAESRRVADVIKKAKPDLVIASQAD